MSLSWRERLDVFLTPERVETLRRGRFMARGKGDFASHALPSAGPDGAREEWREPLARLAGLSMAEGMDLGLVLSSCFCRFQLLPWMEEVQSADERKAYGAIYFREVYGPAADVWEIMVSEEAPGLPSLACAVDRALLEALRSLAVEKTCRLVSVQPAFALAWNRWRGRLAREGAALALAEPGAVVLATVAEGRWLSVRTRRLAGLTLAEALAALQEEQEVSGDLPVSGGLRCLAQGVEPSQFVPGWLALPGSWRDWP